MRFACSHALWALDIGLSHKPVYDFINNLILEGRYTIVYAAEPDPTRVLSAMIAGGIKAKELVEKGALRVIDCNQIFPKDKSASGEAPSFESYFDGQAKRKNWLFIGMPETYFGSKSGYNHQLIGAEQACNSIIDSKLEVVCLHRPSFLRKMSLSGLIRLFHAHRGFIDADGQVERSEALDLTEPIRIGMDRALNNKPDSNLHFSDLVFKTLKLVYHMDEQFMITHPEIFENSLCKMFGNSANMILGSIRNEIIKEMLFESREEK